MREISAREAQKITAEAELLEAALQAETATAFQRLFAGGGTRDDAAIVRDYLRKWCGADPRSPVETFEPQSPRVTDYNLGRLAAWRHIEFLLTFDLDSPGDEARQRKDTVERRRGARARRRTQDLGDMPGGDDDA